MEICVTVSEVTGSRPAVVSFIAQYVAQKGMHACS
jgi:hypothetical protein